MTTTQTNSEAAMPEAINISLEPAPQKVQMLVETADGFLVDIDTGEVVRHTLDARGRFEIDTHEKLEWALEKVFDIDYEIASLEARKKSYCAHVDGMIHPLIQKKSWWVRRFFSDVRARVASELDGAKTRSLKTPFGTLSFTARRESIKITDADAALAWAKMNRPDAVRTVTTETVQVTPLKNIAHSLPEDAFAVTKSSSAFGDSAFRLDNGVSVIKEDAE